MLPSGRPRGKVPEYPRPVPHIDVDEIPICEDTIVYEDWTDEAEQEAEERAKKRRKRRREAAESYLRGGEIRILTASLKGPFGGRWKNPWAKKRLRTEDKIGVEIPETTVRQIHRDRLALAMEKERKGTQADPINIDDGEIVPADGTPCRVERLNPFNARNRDEKVALGQEPSSTKRVEAWLKTNDMYARRPRSHIGSSPTPAIRPSSRHQTPPPKVQARDQQSGNLQNQPMLEVDKQAPPSRPGTSSSVPTHESPRRAETAILEHKKRRSLHTVPPSTNLPAFEYRRRRREERKHFEERPPSAHLATEQLHKPLATNAADSNQQPEPAPVPPAARSGSDAKPESRPGLSAETSKASTSHDLPSAQVTAAARIEPLVSNAHSTEELLQELPSTTRSELQKEHSADLKVGVKTHDPQPGESGQSAREEVSEELGKNARATTGVAVPPPVEQTPVREPETQEMIAAIQPFEFSTIKKPDAGFVRWRTPATVIKAQATAKRKKRASLAVEHPASDDSQQSIKTGLKVTKAIADVGEKPNLKVSLFEEATGAPVGIENLDPGSREETLPSISSMLGSKKASAPKSILKSGNAISSAPVLSGNTTSTSTKQDAQVQPGQNGMHIDLLNEEESFDLDAAIDDLGSYLGTWDADEEAAKLTAAK